MNCCELKKLIQIFREWASKKPFIHEIFLYGSQVQGSVHKESDLDVGIELEPDEGDGSAFTTYVCEVENWRNELQPLVAWPLHLEFYDPAGKTPRIAEGKQKGSILVYKCKRK